MLMNEHWPSFLFHIVLKQYSGSEDYISSQYILKLQLSLYLFVNLVPTLCQSVKLFPNCIADKTARQLPQTDRNPTEHSFNRHILTSREGHMGRRTVEAGESVAARCACEVTQESQSVLLLVCEASVGRDRWERELRHLVLLW